MNGKSGDRPAKPDEAMETLKEWIKSSRKPGKDDGTIQEAVSLTNRMFFETVVSKYGSWERFMEIKGKESQRKGEE